VENDPSGSYDLGKFILWQLGDPAAAQPYLERAAEGGIMDALIDLAVISLFEHGTRLR
jgi:hypothetical protein